MKYKLAGEDEHMFHVQHPDGSVFAIAKHAVGPGVHKTIRGLKPVKMAEGGEVPESDIDASVESIMGRSQPTVADAPLDQPSAALDIQPVTEAEARNPAGGAPQDVVLDQLPPSAAPNSPAPVVPPDPTSSDPYAAVNVAQNKALDAEQDINKQTGNTLASGYQRMAQNQNKLDQDIKANEAHYAPIESDLHSKNEKLAADIVNQKIDHNRVWSNMSTGNKIVAAISVALSGIGSGLTGQRNMAMDVIDKTIDRDIEAQKMELGKKQTLFSENLRQLGDIRAAKAATTSQLLSAAQAKANMIAAQNGSAEVMGRMALANKDLDLRKAALNREAAARAAGRTGGNVDPAVLVPQIVPKEHQKTVFDEVERAQDTRRMGKSILNSFDQAAKDNTILRTGAGIVRTPASVLSLHQSMQPTFKDLEGTVRQAAMDNTFKNITPMPGDSASTIKTKRAALEDYLKSKASAPTAKGFGIDLDKFTSTSTQSAPETATRNGQRYQKVPGGWKKI